MVRTVMRTRILTTPDRFQRRRWLSSLQHSYDWVATPLVYRFGKWLFSDWKELGLSEQPEIFPKQSEISAGKFGNWLRLPGRHHTRDHWTRVWDGQNWLEGIDAIEWILRIKGSSADMIPADAR